MARDLACFTSRRYSLRISLEEKSNGGRRAARPSQPAPARPDPHGRAGREGAFLVIVPSRIELELRALNDDEYEQLVFALVVAEFPHIDWRRVVLVRAPDGGVDVMLVGEVGGRRIGWQAKQTAEPRWTDWERSLDGAVEKHEVDELTFVFPFNLTRTATRDVQHSATRSSRRCGGRALDARTPRQPAPEAPRRLRALPRARQRRRRAAGRPPRPHDPCRRQDRGCGRSARAASGDQRPARRQGPELRRPCGRRCRGDPVSRNGASRPTSASRSSSTAARL